MNRPAELTRELVCVFSRVIFFFRARLVAFPRNRKNREDRMSKRWIQAAPTSETLMSGHVVALLRVGDDTLSLICSFLRFADHASG